MIGRRGLSAMCACLLLVATLCPCAQSRRGGFGRGFGGRMSHRPSNTGMKMAGAAAAGAVGGAMIGHGLGSMGRPGYGGYGGYGYGGYGRYGGYPRYGGGHSSGGLRNDGSQNETDGDYYYDSSSCHATNGFVILGSMVSFMIGYWMGN